jgi:hypothetical protein
MYESIHDVIKSQSIQNYFEKIKELKMSDFTFLPSFEATGIKSQY